jgi:PAS domain S-box-containing protein
MTAPPPDPRIQRAPSLKRALISLAAALAIPLVALQIWWGYHDYEKARERAETDALAQADATSLGVLQFFSQAEQLLTSTAEQFGPDGLTSVFCDQHMATITDLLPFLVNVVVVGPDGDVLCSQVEITGRVSATSWSWWAEVRANPVFTIGRPAESDITSGWVLPIIAPQTDRAGEFAAALVGTVDLVGLDQYFGTVNLPEDHLITVATADRIVIARSRDAATRVGRSLPPQYGSDREVGPGRSVAAGPDLAGIQRTWGQIEVPQGWIIYAGVREEAVYGPALQETLGHLAITLLVVLIAFLLAGHSYRDIAGALTELGNRTRDIARGEPVVVPIKTPSEVAEVFERFNETIVSREQAQRREQEARARYKTIFDNVVFGLYLSTSDGRFLEVNSALATMLGYESPAALLPVGTHALYASGEERGRLVQHTLSSGEVPPSEVDWLCADGRPITVRLSGKLILGQDDEPLLEMIVQDITEERRTEHELRQTQKMDAMGQLAGGIAHDFNNLLTVIGGNVELLEDDIPPDDPLRRDLAEISRATKRATSLTRRLLTFSSKQRRGDQVADANEIISGLRKLLIPLIGEDVALETDLGGGPFPIAIDPGELEQVVLNLVLNARDALPRGGTIRITTAASDRDAEEGVLGMALSVTDDGVGMAPEIRQRIFEPFFTTKPMGRGTGLGLSTVYGIVMRAGGSMEVETQAGEGTAMRIWLPRTQFELSETEPEANLVEGGHETILVVEDEAQVMELVRRTLSESGYRVVTATDGVAGLDVFQACQPPVQLVLTDVVMPHLGGPELADKLDLIAPDVPVLFMSGYVENRSLSEALEQEPDLLLRKPFSPNELRARVRRILDLAAVARPGSPP